MQDFVRLSLPIDRAAAASLKAGDKVLLSGVLYTGRDAAHKRFRTCLEEGRALPVNLSGQTLYYVGPCFAPDSTPTGAGPTTSARMDVYAPALYDNGVVATVGKGDRSPAVYEAIKRNGGLYLCAIGGAGALYAQAIEECTVAAYPDLGTEAVFKMTVRDFPAVVGIDQRGNSVFGG